MEKVQNMNKKELIEQLRDELTKRIRKEIFDEVYENLYDIAYEEAKYIFTRDRQPSDSCNDVVEKIYNNIYMYYEKHEKGEDTGRDIVFGRILEEIRNKIKDELYHEIRENEYDEVKESVEKKIYNEIYLDIAEEQKKKIYENSYDEIIEKNNKTIIKNATLKARDILLTDEKFIQEVKEEVFREFLDNSL